MEEIGNPFIEGQTVDKRNLECFNCEKKGYFKSEYRAKPKDQTDYRNIRFLESEQPEIESSSDSEMEEITKGYEYLIKNIMQLKIYGGPPPIQLLMI